jgi:tetratricopeptide (TPR) repeat protein
MSRSAIPTSALVLALALSSAPASAQRPTRVDDDSAALVGEGRAALRRGALDAAASALDQAIALNPRRVEAYVLRSAVHEARGDYRAGIALLRRALELAPDDADVLAALGAQLVLSGDTAAGVPLLRRVVAGDPARYAAQLVLARHAYARSSWSEAIAAFEAYFVARPRELAGEDVRHRVDLGDAYLRDGQPAKALAELERAARAGKPDLRTRLAIAWATAALDCRRARSLLRELEPVAGAHPDVWLVDGRCALALGQLREALQRGRQYLEATRSAAGHALIGDVHAAQGQLAQARRELELARDLEPGQRRWGVRLAHVLRRGGDARAALAVLERLGPPPAPRRDPAWWLELGEALLARGDTAAVLGQLGPAVAELPGHAEIRTVLGAAQLAERQAEAAARSLEAAEAIASTPRSRGLLAQALAIVALDKLTAGDAVAAEPLLARAARLEASPAILRDLGIARLAIDRPRDAIAALDHALRLDAAPITMMLGARARALAGDLAGARPLYERALGRAGGSDAVEIAIDWAASEIAGDDPASAVAALEATGERAASGRLASRHAAALAEARHAAGLAALLAGNAPRAVELLRASAAAAPAVATSCDLALAAVAANDAPTALGALKAVGGRSCRFPPPADLQITPILSALVDGLSPRRAGRSLERLAALAARSSGVAAGLAATAIRVVALEAAADAYRRDNLALARKLLATARGATARVGGDEVAHDLVAIDLADGLASGSGRGIADRKLDAAIAQLERLAPRMTEALVALGIAYERKGDPRKALEAWRRARKGGSRFAPLAEWIEAKERIHEVRP